VHAFVTPGLTPAVRAGDGAHRGPTHPAGRQAAEVGRRTDPRLRAEVIVAAPIGVGLARAVSSLPALAAADRATLVDVLMEAVDVIGDGGER
jgi:Tetracyclin repressor-like, C-terminal domain